MSSLLEPSDLEWLIDEASSLHDIARTEQRSAWELAFEPVLAWDFGIIGNDVVQDKVFGVKAKDGNEVEEDTFSPKESDGFGGVGEMDNNDEVDEDGEIDDKEEEDEALESFDIVENHEEFDAVGVMSE